MSEYNPDKWVIVKFKDKTDTWYKVLGSWYGGYLNGDSWRMSSGLERIEEDGDNYKMHNASGSVYICHKNMEGMHLTSHGIFETMVKQAKEQDVEVTRIGLEQYNNETKPKAKKPCRTCPRNKCGNCPVKEQKK